MSNKSQTDAGEEAAPKTPLELVREGQDKSRDTLAQAAHDQSTKAHGQQGEDARADTSPEVPGQGPPSSIRTHPQRDNR
jgi:hypothetical protein